MKIRADEFYYHDTKSEDGITHIVQVGEPKVATVVYVEETYWGIDKEKAKKIFLLQLERELLKEKVIRDSESYLYKRQL